MRKPGKLSAGECNILSLISKESVDGWATVSKGVFPLVEALPAELVSIEKHGEKYRCALTPEGHSVVYAMGWL